MICNLNPPGVASQNLNLSVTVQRARCFFRFFRYLPPEAVYLVLWDSVYGVTLICDLSCSYSRPNQGGLNSFQGAAGVPRPPPAEQSGWKMLRGSLLYLLAACGRLYRRPGRSQNSGSVCAVSGSGVELCCAALDSCPAGVYDARVDTCS